MTAGGTGRRPAFRALVLSAGLGTRLRPLTWSLPKPLLPVCGEPLVCHTLRRLRQGGCDAAVLNVHHLPEAIPGVLGNEFSGLPLHYSHEDPILGTLGALGPPRALLGQAESVVLVNGDTLCPWPVQSVVRRHRATGADVTLLLAAREPDPGFGGGVAVDEAGRVVQLRGHPQMRAVGKLRRRVFAGLHVVKPEFLDRVADGVAGDIIEGLYQPLLAEGGTIRGVVTQRAWHDLGTPGRYLAAALDLAGRSWEGRLRRGLHVGDGAKVAEDAVLRRSVIEDGATVESGARVEQSLVLPGAKVGRDAVLRRVVVGPDVVLSAGTRVDDRMLTRRHPKHVLRSGESMIGELVYTPLG